ncbi:hypothetical protein [Streptomyces aureus]|uniref:hypothetical protein n=1 Tax=Streptomyces aureus TaxID=193461 RepID=UPI0006E14403
MPLPQSLPVGFVAWELRRGDGARLDGVPHGVAETAREGVANAVEAAGTAGSHERALIRAAQESFVDGWQQAMWAGVVVMAAPLLRVLARGPTGARPETPGKGDDNLRGITERSPEGSFPSA